MVVHFGPKLAHHLDQIISIDRNEESASYMPPLKNRALAVASLKPLAVVRFLAEKYSGVHFQPSSQDNVVSALPLCTKLSPAPQPQAIVPHPVSDPSAWPRAVSVQANVGCAEAFSGLVGDSIVYRPCCVASNEEGGYSSERCRSMQKLCQWRLPLS